MKLLLTSNGFENPEIAKEFLRLVGKPAEEIKILFIPIASRSIDERNYANKSKQELYDIGIKYENIRILNINKKPLSEAEMFDYDTIYICGGNTFYLMQRLRETKFHQKIKQYLKKSGVYVGVSAGSIILGSDIEIAGLGKTGDENDIGLEDFKGLNLINQVIYTHYIKSEEQLIRNYEKKTKQKVLRLKDNQALLINNKQEKVIG